MSQSDSHISYDYSINYMKKLLFLGQQFLSNNVLGSSH